VELELGLGLGLELGLELGLGRFRVRVGLVLIRLEDEQHHEAYTHPKCVSRDTDVEITRATCLPVNENQGQG